MPVPENLFKQVVSRFATGVTIVTLKNDAGLHGLTVNSFTSVSLDPPLILVCIQKTVSSHAYFLDATGFVVNILSKNQVDLSNRFADPSLTSEERFQGVGFHKSESGAPILDGCLAYLECEIAEQVQGGDHTIFIGKVVHGETTGEDAPLLFYMSNYLR